ncbi:metallophosphoesterase family protein [Merismopedia glauca]|uniref:Metallophosphoesterase n=1 Tax=Merismopedia glauca CCAP 1448/3 TaxID=1296344 RepID=A0A2T1C0K2_9CYAN|nr:metallophosphoesterase [Merismopedia glauca]PSB01799.1 metallophosphoesterase [Merismopedia glauca CCAP 1448/3]
MTQKIDLLADPFLQLPTSNSVRVVWFTEFAGKDHLVAYGESASVRLCQTACAITFKLTRIREDSKSRLREDYQNNILQETPQLRHIWRHEAEITNLIPGVRIPYQVTSITEEGEQVSSQIFTLAPSPVVGIPLKVLLTSDHQLMPMTAANLQKVVETVGRVDAVFFAGDLVNVSDRASQWFDDSSGGAFFPCLQGKASYQLTKNGISTIYRGGEIIQHAPLFTAIGNHEVIGRFSLKKSLNQQFYDAIPKQVAEKFPSDGKSLLDRTFNTNTYEEIFSLPQSDTGGKKYYAVTFGDIRLVVLYITNIWRNPTLEDEIKGRYREATKDLPNPENWGYGQHIFEPIHPGSPQYIWLENELKSPEFSQAKYKIAMFHHPPHTLGDNIVPAYTDPVQVRETDLQGNLTAIRYEYPKHADYIIRDVVPLLESAGVQMVYFGHSHLWNRFMSAKGVHYLESSNVGNSYGAAWGDRPRFIPTGYQEEYVAIGDPNGLEPIVPNIAPVLDTQGNPLPYIASNDITVFSILDTGSGTVSSYRFDTCTPEVSAVKFDEFSLK